MGKLETPMTWGLAIGLMASLFIGNLTSENKNGEWVNLQELGSEDLNNDNIISDIFEENCKTVSAYITDFSSEILDYNNYYAANAVIKGTLIGSNDSITISEHKARHDIMFPKYNFSYSSPLKFLPGVNSKTKEMDGSVRFYCSINVTETTTQKSVSIPMYYSFDFDDEGKFLYQQFYGDITAHINYLNED